ncbi:hypothetical protein K493DRAFT_311215 [Basidiobolus meristosporus CBS 931.73]|uniref:BED-type domain-containing protein n=1 Tax=Basidiobolus meristosporus CBS 931.73 TaxID=1314790 RepID=A0A1Y1Z4B2_9FUNG|nr:hypothetical protein K493DRAFT_311215 [Basidiobolus meristosporus CBS 931.73]|eukprot:ORY04827.1 hypothetical protein K493DRAFT_311215 [Basidiobolus meristosporus CBS 931.73]
MAKKKRKTIRPWCWYCERDFDDEKVLIQHQKAKHFKCPHCSKKLNTAGGMVVHVAQVHKETISKVPNALKGRESTDIEIFGMEGIPEEDQIAHLQAIEGDNPSKRLKSSDSTPEVQTPPVTMASYPPSVGASYSVPRAPPAAYPSYPAGYMAAPQYAAYYGVPVPPYQNPYGYRPGVPAQYAQPAHNPWARPPVPGAAIPPQNYYAPPAPPAPGTSPYTQPAAAPVPTPVPSTGIVPTSTTYPAYTTQPTAPVVPSSYEQVVPPAAGVLPTALEEDTSATPILATSTLAAPTQGKSSTVLVYNDSELSIEETRARLDKYRYTDEDIKRQVEQLDLSIESRLAGFKGKSS